SVSSPLASPALLSFPTRRSSDLKLIGFHHIFCIVVFNSGLSSLCFGNPDTNMICGKLKKITVSRKNRHVHTLSFAFLCQSSQDIDRKSTRLNSSHVSISYAVFCL